MNDFEKAADAGDKAVLDPSYEETARQSDVCVKWVDET